VKILFITARTDLGGGPKHLLDLFKSLSQTEIYLASPIEGPFGPELLKYTKKNVVIKKRSFSIFDYIKILFFIYQNEIKIIHSHGRGAGLYARLLKFFGLKVIHTFHGIHRETGFIGTIKYLIDRVLAPYADHYICVSDDEKVKAKAEHFLGKVPTTVIYNGVDLSLFKYNFKDQEIKVLGCMARASYQKGYDILFAHLIVLKKQWPDFKFNIAGPSENEITIPFELLSNCQILGQVDPLTFLNQIDLYISASRWEGMPLAILEAMAIGVPCLLSDVVGHQHFISKEMVCATYKPLNHLDFFKKIESLKNNSIRKKMAANARALISESNSAVNVTKKTWDIYNEIYSTT